jgi:60 kDa SS-A/Ro ribonucleoprotein
MQLNSLTKNTPTYANTTHEGGPAYATTPLQQLRRTLLTCMLWENTFYENGVSVADRIASLVPQVDATDCMALALEARHNMKLRHAPLLVAAVMARQLEHKKLVAHTLEAVIDRADELAEFVAIYAQVNGVTPRTVRKHLSAQVKKGLARAFLKFSAYDLAKYNRDKDVKLRDVAFLSHVKAGEDRVRGKVLAQLVNKDRYPTETKAGFRVKREYGLHDYEPLATPDTWEVGLSALGQKELGEADKVAAKREEWVRLLTENKLGALALLRNLRNMVQVGVDRMLVREALERMKVERVLPFRFVAAARAAPEFEPFLEQAMMRCLVDRPKLPGHTVFLGDISGSMGGGISAKSDLRRIDAMAALAILARELCEDATIVKFDDRQEAIPARRGFALRDAFGEPRGGTMLGAAVEFCAKYKYDRIIAITDEQSADRVGAPLKGSKGYMINVAAHKNGVGYGPWVHIDGWSEAVFDYILATEGMEVA